MDHFTFSDTLSHYHERIESKLQNKSENVSTHDMYCIDRTNSALYAHMGRNHSGQVPEGDKDFSEVKQPSLDQRASLPISNYARY